MLNVKLHYFGHLVQRANSLERTLMLGKTEYRRRRGWWQRMRWLDGVTDSMDMFEHTLGDGEWQGILVCCTPWGGRELDITDQQNRTESVSYYVWADGVNPNWNSSVQFSHSVMFNSLQPRGLQHASLPCPSPIPGACSNSCPLSQGYHPTVSILCHPLLLLPSILPNIRLFSNESVLCIRWPKC